MSLRKTLYGEDTTMVNFRVPLSKKDEIKIRVFEILREYEFDWSSIERPKKEKEAREDVVIAPDIVEEIIEKEEIVETNNYNRVFTLPKDKVLVKLGVYSSGEFFYTTKVISSKLFIYQWNSLEEVEKYLETFK